MTLHRADLLERIGDSRARVAVVGLGYVGLPLLLRVFEAGYRVVGVEIDRGRLAALKEARPYVDDVSHEALARALGSGRVTVTDDAEALTQADVIHICVPTPVLGGSREPNLEHLCAAASSVLRCLTPGHLVIVESTTYPGATRDLLSTPAHDLGLQAGVDVFIAFSPERIDPGNSVHDLGNTPKVLGGVTRACTDVAAEYYARVVDVVVPVSTSDTAEMVKLAENTFRAVNIALANELAQTCHALGVDVWEVVAAAATKPFGYMPFYPGAGVGGHCIPVDPHYLTWRARAEGQDCPLIGAALQVNQLMPGYVVGRIQALAAKPLRDQRVLLVGVAYKADVRDTRESAACEVMRQLLALGADVAFHDTRVGALHLAGTRYSSVLLDERELRAADVTVVLTPHRDVDYALVGAGARVVLDAANAVDPAECRGQLERL
jgi:UDP-N-acetyl-D-glucosamine dehydrogenase